MLTAGWWWSEHVLLDRSAAGCGGRYPRHAGGAGAAGQGGKLGPQGQSVRQRARDATGDALAGAHDQPVGYAGLVGSTTASPPRTPITALLEQNWLTHRSRTGEKFIEWSDSRYPVSLKTIQTFTSFYWFTNSYGRAMWAYRSLSSVVGGPLPNFPLSLTKPFGYSSFFVEIAALPRAWAEHLFPNLVLYKAHDKASRPMPRDKHTRNGRLTRWVTGRTLCGTGTAPAVSAGPRAVSDACCAKRHWVGPLSGYPRLVEHEVSPALLRHGEQISRCGNDAGCSSPGSVVEVGQQRLGMFEEEKKSKRCGMRRKAAWKVQNDRRW